MNCDENCFYREKDGRCYYFVCIRDVLETERRYEYEKRTGKQWNKKVGITFY